MHRPDFRQLRLEAGLTQKEVLKELKISNRALRRIKSGEMTASYEVMCKLYEMLGLGTYRKPGLSRDSEEYMKLHLERREALRRLDRKSDGDWRSVPDDDPDFLEIIRLYDGKSIEEREIKK